MYLTSKSGYSLVEMVVTMGIMGIIIMGSMSAIDIIEREKKISENGMTLNDIKTTILGQFGNRDLCSNMMGVNFFPRPEFIPGTLGPQNITLYRDDGDTPWLVPAPGPTENIIGNFKVENVHFYDESGALPTRTADSVGGDNFRYITGNVELVVRNLAKPGSISESVKLPITLKVEISDTNKLVACKATNPDERMPIDLPRCLTSEMLTYDPAIRQWTCIDVPGAP